MGLRCSTRRFDATPWRIILVEDVVEKKQRHGSRGIPPWSGAEIDYLREAYHRGDHADDIAIALRELGVARSVKAVKSRASTLRIFRDPRRWRVSGLISSAEAFGGYRFTDDPRAVAADKYGPQPSRSVFGST